jgi:ATP-dependent exoDNAse (exonuclease V) beta subunit
MNSFIPNDLKRAFGLPLYLEKDAIYAYHFYRLLRKASDVTITYDSETDTFGKGEKSRFVTQLQLEMKNYNPEITITEEVASYKEFPEELKNDILIQKNDEVLSAIYKKAISKDDYGGLSPSGLISYKDCSLKFYFRYGARLKETKEVEESAEANTFGSILHLSLETLYKDLVGKIISANTLKEKLPQIDDTVNQSFSSFFDGTAPVGKSILQQEVIKVYVKKLLNNDLKFIDQLKAQNHVLSLVDLEKEYSSPIEVTFKGKSTTLFIKGKIDRVDSYQGLVRVIDYKSSVKSSDKFSFVGFDKLFTDPDYNKQLQLFLYAWLVYKNKICAAEKIQACIIPFKVFAEEPKYIKADKGILMMTDQLLEDFETELRLFIGSVFDEKLPFKQTEDTELCKFCAYNVICNL